MDWGAVKRFAGLLEDGETVALGGHRGCAWPPWGLRGLGRRLICGS